MIRQVKIIFGHQVPDKYQVT